MDTIHTLPPAVNAENPVTCPRCGGAGVVKPARPGGPVREICGVCRGEGVVDPETARRLKESGPASAAIAGRPYILDWLPVPAGCSYEAVRFWPSGSPASEAVVIVDRVGASCSCDEHRSGPGRRPVDCRHIKALRAAELAAVPFACCEGEIDPCRSCAEEKARDDYESAREAVADLRADWLADRPHDDEDARTWAAELEDIYRPSEEDQQWLVADAAARRERFQALLSERADHHRHVDRSEDGDWKARQYAELLRLARATDAADVGELMDRIVALSVQYA